MARYFGLKRGQVTHVEDYCKTLSILQAAWCCVFHVGFNTLLSVNKCDSPVYNLINAKLYLLIRCTCCNDCLVGLEKHKL